MNNDTNNNTIKKNNKKNTQPHIEDESQNKQQEETRQDEAAIKITSLHILITFSKTPKSVHFMVNQELRRCIQKLTDILSTSHPHNLIYITSLPWSNKLSLVKSPYIWHAITHLHSTLTSHLNIAVCAWSCVQWFAAAHILKLLSWPQVLINIPTGTPL